jgi:SAM-dependent methyltransferase
MRTKLGGEITGAALLAYYRTRGYDPRRFTEEDRRYGRTLVRVFRLTGKMVIDVGCGGGAFTAALRAAGANAYGVEIEACFVENHAPGVDGRILLWPPNRPAFPPETFDFAHESQVLEHVPEDAVPAHLAAIRYVLRPGALFYASLVLGPHPGDGPGDDDTHINYKPREWWLARAAESGFADETALWATDLTSDPWFARHGWTFIVLRRV